MGRTTPSYRSRAEFFHEKLKNAVVDVTFVRIEGGGHSIAEKGTPANRMTNSDANRQTLAKSIAQTRSMSDRVCVTYSAAGEASTKYY